MASPSCILSEGNASCPNWFVGHVMPGPSFDRRSHPLRSLPKIAGGNRQRHEKRVMDVLSRKATEKKYGSKARSIYNLEPNFQISPPGRHRKKSERSALHFPSVNFTCAESRSFLFPDLPGEGCLDFIRVAFSFLLPSFLRLLRQPGIATASSRSQWALPDLNHPLRSGARGWSRQCPR